MNQREVNVREKILLAGAVTSIAIAGALAGTGTLYLYGRMNVLQNQHDTLVSELTQKVLPEIQKKFDVAAATQQDSTKTSKK